MSGVGIQGKPPEPLSSIACAGVKTPEIHTRTKTVSVSMFVM